MNVTVNLNCKWTIKDNENYVFENHVLVITHDDIEKLKELNEVILNLSTEFSKFFNSSNLTATELLNFSY